MNSYEEQDFNNEKFNINTWKKIFKIVLTHKKNLIIMLLSVALLSILDILNPLLNASALKKFFENKDYTDIWIYIVLYASVAVGYFIAIFGFIRMAGIVEVETGYELRRQAFVRLQELPFAYYDKTPAGWIMARLTSDSRRLAEILSWGLVDILWSAFTMFAVLVVLFIYDWRIALILTVFAPIVFSICLYFQKRILKSYRDVRKVNSKITASYNEGFMATKTTKTLVLENERQNEFKELCSNMKAKSIKAVINTSIIWPVVLVAIYFAISIALGVSVILSISVSTIYLAINYIDLFFDPVMQMTNSLAELQQAQASAERIIMLIETKAEIDDTEEVKAKYGTIFENKKENWEDIKGDVEFDHVSFSYIENEIVLNDFNLNIKAGTSVALVGSTGSGKSTIVNLLCRFYEPTKGIIKLDGKNYKDRSISWLHSKLGYVLQTPHLFNGSIKDNIRYGKLNATDEEIIAAAKAVNADEFIIKFEEGYNTNVGEGGAKLSVGQRQLISFARAIICDPKILILDEATSSIDTETEYIIQDVMNKLMKGRTTFVVAHRLSTIINADVILVIQDGKIIEQGNHRELLAKEGEYFNLYKNQFINEQIDKSII